MLAENTVEDVNGITLAEGDCVIYMNLRYGCGGKLCYGTIKKFKANVRQNFISVIITNNEDVTEESELNYPSMQIIKLNKETT